MKTALERLRERQENTGHLRAEFTRLTEYGIRLRCSDPPNGDRAQALRYLSQQIEAFAARCEVLGKDGKPTGYSDPADPWADETLLMLREDLAELSRGDAPYPVALPAGCALLPVANFDPFRANPPRYYSGKVATARPTEGA